MLYGKIDRYILIAILVVAILAVALIFITRKENNERHDSQDDLLMAMAEKLRVSNMPNQPSSQEEKPKSKKNEPTEDEEDQIIDIADKICFNMELNAEEKSLQVKFPQEIQKRLQQSRQILGSIINKFISGSKDFDEYEKEYYENFQEQIDNIIIFKKSVDAIVLKISQGITDFSDEELQFKQKYPKQIEAALLQIKRNESGKESNNLKGANPPVSADERLKIILNIFEDEIPRTVTELATIYAEKAKVTFNKGNMSKIFGKLVDNGQLMCEKFKNGKVYHGLPSWFENKKLKSNYKQNINS